MTLVEIGCIVDLSQIFKASPFTWAVTNTGQIVPNLYYVTGERLLNPNCNAIRNLLALLYSTQKTESKGSASYPRILPSSQSSPEIYFLSGKHLFLNNAYSKDIQNDNNTACKLCWLLWNIFSIELRYHESLQSSNITLFEVILSSIHYLPPHDYTFCF